MRLGTRGSRLALVQAAEVAAALRTARPGLEVEVTTISTTGDRILDSPLSRIGGKGLFTKEIDEALLEGRIDLAVHSMKDVPTELPEGILIAAVPPRLDPRDVLVTRDGCDLAGLPRGARLGTSSLRRRAQVLSIRPDLAVLDLRGGVPTRVRRLAAGDFDATILAAAGLERLRREGLPSGAVFVPIDPALLVPAVGQGSLAVTARAGDSETRAALAPLECAEARVRATAERALLRVLEGGCQVPLGCLAEVEAGRLRVRARVLSLDGARRLEGEAEGACAEAEEIGASLGRRLLGEGAAEVIEAARRAAAASGPSREGGSVRG